MRRIGISLFVLIAFDVVPGGVTWAGEKGESPAPDERLRQAVLQAENSGQAGKAYRTLFKALDREGLEGLEHDRDSGIALQAAWELHVERAIRGKRSPHPERFLGFLEGRTKLRVPLRWEVELVTEPLPSDRIAPAMEDYLPIAPFFSKEDGLYKEEPERFDETNLGPRVPSGTRLTRTEGGITIMVRDATVTMDEKLFQQIKKEPRGEFDELRAVLGPKFSYIAWYDPIGDPFPLVCLDSRSGKLRWRVKSWGSGADNRLGYSGPTRHDVYVSVASGKVVLFGRAFGGGCYLEAFSEDTGSSLYRFSTSYWCVSGH
jgi:hypothetical protein